MISSESGTVTVNGRVIWSNLMELLEIRDVRSVTVVMVVELVLAKEMEGNSETFQSFSFDKLNFDICVRFIYNFYTLPNCIIAQYTCLTILLCKLQHFN